MAWSDWLADDLGSPVTPMLAHMFARVVYANDFCPSRNGAGTACPWPRTLGQGVGEQWRGLQGWLPTLGLRLHRCFHTSWHGVDETDFCPFRNGAGAACPWPRTLGQGVGEQWRGLTGWLPTLGLRLHRCSHTSWLGRRRDRFRPLRFLTGLTHSPCHQVQLPIGIVGGGYQPYCRSVLGVKVCACRNF